MFESTLLKDKVIVVTGGGTGLGLSMALRFAELGAKLAITSRRQEVIDKSAEAIRAKGVEALAVPCDVRDYAGVEAMIAKVVETFGRVDCLVNNAAGNFLCPTEELSPGGFNAIVGIVLGGTFNCTLAAGKQMIKQGDGGNVLSITTTYAETGSAYVVPSACGKAGVLALTRSLAVEWAKYKIRFNAIAPGPFPTKGAWERLVPPDIAAAMMSKDRIPARRFGEHHELANLAAYLLAGGSDYLTGQQISIDGGESLMNGQFNGLTLVDPTMVSEVMSKMRPKK
jgi:NAD(P)-dependent dehydrogenase (short-subunit alcohol dehydrogenase family)